MSEEELDIVDEKDRVIGRDTRSNVHSSRSWHRGIHVILINGKGEILLQMRGPVRDKFPSTYDVSVSEHVRSGETYEHAASRGLLEELGIADAEPRKVLHFRMNYGDPCDNMVGVVYRLLYPGPIRMDRKEIASIAFFSTEEIKVMLSQEKNMFAPWAYEILRWHLGMPSKVEQI